MWVCLCRQVSDKQIKSLVDEGHSQIENIKRACGAGTGCGGCVDNLAKIIADQKDPKKQAASDK